ncbi:MAG: pentapeptide repeat-containing protein, partial [bacterium]
MIAKSSSYLLGILLCLFCGGFLQSAWAYNTEDLRRLKVTGSCPRCDLSAASLEELQLFRSNLSGANLSGA